MRYPEPKHALQHRLAVVLGAGEGSAPLPSRVLLPAFQFRRSLAVLAILAMDRAAYPAVHGYIDINIRAKGDLHKSKGDLLMSTLGFIEYEQASPEVRAVYDDIMATRKIDKVTNFWKALAHDCSEKRGRTPESWVIRCHIPDRPRDP